MKKRDRLSVLIVGLCAVVALLVPRAAMAAPDLTGLTVAVEYVFTPAVITHDDVVVGAGSEISCPGDPFELCTFFGGEPVVVDISANSIAYSNPLGVDYGAAPFNGLRFSGLGAGGPWASFSFNTNFDGLDASRIAFDGDVLTVNLQSIVFTGGEAGQFFELTLLPERVAPEPALLLLLGLGLSFIAFRVRASRRHRS